TAGTCRFEWSIRAANGIRILSGTRDVFFQPFVNERSAVAQALASLKETVLKVEEKFPASAKALLREVHSLELTKEPVEALQDRAITNPDLAKEALDRTKDLVRKAAHLRRLSDTVARTTASGDITDLIVFEGQVWESREVGMEMPEHAGSPLVLHRRVVLGEHEPISLRVLNITDAEQTVRASIENQAEGIDCVLHRAVAVPTSLGEVSWDPLPKLDETQTFSVPSLSSREAWVDIHVGDVRPGSHTIEIDFQAITGTGLVGGPSNPHSAATPKTKVRIELDVLPFTPAPSGSIRLCMWASLDKAAVEDLLAHGGNVFVVPHGSPIRDENNRIQEVDFTQLDALLEFLKGEDVILLLNGSPQNPYKIGTEEYESDLRSYLDLLIDHLADWGFDLNHFALYPHDEPGGIGWNAVNSLVEFGQVVKRINPKLMLYVDGGGEREMFEAMAPVIDIWTPSITMLREDTPEMRVIREDGGMLWSYDCVYAYARPVGANLKNISIIPQYRTAALFALRHDATGIGFWCYNIGESLWGRTLFEYPVVYEGQSGPVTSRRWEAIREGLEDFRILTALNQRLREGQLTEEVRDKIDHLLNVSLPKLVDPASDATVLGLGRFAIDQYLGAEKLKSFRIEMLDCVNALSTSGN
ncbi:MAG: hypothetical protein KC978_06655, partial [Candidatus Omnitrophica bacterium]|nr:hypothetical protein [Candidatus Omnitrophota bacterium]